VRGFPAGFERPADISWRLAEVVLYDLPDDFFNTYVDKVEAVSLGDVKRVARKILTPDKATIIVVGDAEKVRAGLEELELGPVEVIKPEDLL
jgi:zinc protease